MPFTLDEHTGARAREISGPYARDGRSALLPVLHALQHEFGKIDQATATVVSQTLGVPLADVFGVIEYYGAFTSTRSARRTCHVCVDAACILRGSAELLARAQAIARADASGDVQPTGCLGHCAHGPAARFTEVGAEDAVVAPFSADSGDVWAAGGRSRLEMDFVAGDPAMISSRVGTADAGSPRWDGLRRATAMAGEAIVEEIKRSGLLGRGGAAFPAGAKWDAVRRAPGALKHVIINGDESEPGTFKDRILMEQDPFRVWEGALIAARAVGANRIWLYVRGEYPAALAHMRAAASRIQAILPAHGLHVQMEIRVGAGAYVCGEETALIESIEGKRGFPRIKPPFPVTKGLFDQPTLVHNVETLAAAAVILALGAPEWRSHGTAGSPGPKLFCVSGDVARPGLYEAAHGVTVRQLIARAQGAPRGVAAVLVGGASGSFIQDGQLDIPLSVEDLRAAGLSLGSGAVTVFGRGSDLRAAVLRLGEFFAHESCGKCFPCQLGTQRQFEILGRVARRSLAAGDRERLADLDWAMTNTSLCGLGQTAASAVRSAMLLWPEWFLVDGRQNTGI